MSTEYVRACWNWQTGTFEGRVFMTYGFKSRRSHQQKSILRDAFLFMSLLTVIPRSNFQRKGCANEQYHLAQGVS